MLTGQGFFVSGHRHTDLAVWESGDHCNCVDYLDIYLIKNPSFVVVHHLAVTMMMSCRLGLELVV